VIIHHDERFWEQTTEWMNIVFGFLSRPDDRPIGQLRAAGVFNVDRLGRVVGLLEPAVNLFDNGRRSAVVYEAVLQGAGIVEMNFRTTSFDVNSSIRDFRKEIGPLQSGEGRLCGVSSLFGRAGGTLGDREELGSGSPKSVSKQYKQGIEENKQPVRGLLQKIIVPSLFLLSIGAVWLLGWADGRAGGWAVLALGSGWLTVIVWFGVLHK
jgi:hypothetical protein